MSAPPMKILCRYQYDPLDRLVGLKPLENPGTQRFYQEDELVNEIEDQSQLTIMRHGPQPLAQRSGTAAAAAETTLLATDQQRSLLRTVADADSRQMAYTAYGYRTGESGLSCLLGFNGERPESITGHYLLGQGNRAFNPVLMRFNSPDELSPFGDGGINAYAYCGNDPVNRYDPSGNVRIAIANSYGWGQLRLQLKVISRSPPKIRSFDPNKKYSSISASEATSSAVTRRKTLIYEKEGFHSTKKLSTHTDTARIRNKRAKNKELSDKWKKYFSENPDTPDRADPKLKSLLKSQLEKLEAKTLEANKLGLTKGARHDFLNIQRTEVSRIKLRVNRSRWENLPQNQTQVREQT
ncbi:Rhs family protein [Pseudomonas fluorescens Q2-87]|uniref:Rhs family protein n=1 Tax=Pseudomonas fluorescens (strain Q2-87) TaxID=1038922 RepID=J2F8K5_PSEFQ|nr:RHS repeat-associated core domain-containing protein [Pseudomonas fluorescens]EJL05483.1 Rhs family protein [Pseudomonas fluorescens Q2-87]